MTSIRRKSIGLLIILWVFSFSLGWAESPAAMNSDLDDIQRLLQKGLQIHEIDQELLRIADKEAATTKEIQEIENTLVSHGETVSKKQEQAGRVLRSYYMGQREALYLSLLKMDNLMDAIAVLDFIQIIFNYDQVTLASYRDSIQTLKLHKDRLAQTQQELRTLKQAFLAQREDQLRLEEELETELASVPAAAEIRTEIELLTEAWERDGLPLFKQYFSSLSASMRELPELVASDGDHLTIKGSNILFQISDEQLNAFLRSKDELLSKLLFRFADGYITAEGTDQHIHIAMQGRYVLEDAPENRIRFRIDALSFNDFDLPESTARALEEQFDLSIYPDKFILKVEATAVRMKNNILQIQLKAAGDWLDSIFGGWLF